MEVIPNLIKYGKSDGSGPLNLLEFYKRGIRSLIDKDARVGHKSKTENFYGYKAEYCMTEIITAFVKKNK